MALPENHATGGQRGFGAAAQFLVGVPKGHFFERDAHCAGGVAAEVLIRKEEHAPRSGEGPVENGGRVARRTNDSAMPATERLEAGGRVDIGDRGDVIGIDHFAELVPTGFDLFDHGHIGHRAPGGQVGQNDGNAAIFAFGETLLPIGENVGRFGHEVDAAKDN